MLGFLSFFLLASFLAFCAFPAAVELGCTLPVPCRLLLAPDPLLPTCTAMIRALCQTHPTVHAPAAQQILHTSYKIAAICQWLGSPAFVGRRGSVPCCGCLGGQPTAGIRTQGRLVEAASEGISEGAAPGTVKAVCGEWSECARQGGGLGASVRALSLGGTHTAGRWVRGGARIQGQFVGDLGCRLLPCCAAARRLECLGRGYSCQWHRHPASPGQRVQAPPRPVWMGLRMLSR